MNRLRWTQSVGLCVAVISVILGSGCELLRQKASQQPSFYTLDVTGGATRTQEAQYHPVPSVGLPILIVNPPSAASGFDSQHIVYMREAHRLEYFAHSEWVDTPARMLGPLIVAAVENSEVYAAVLPAPSTATGNMRLDTEILRFQQEFNTTPSVVHFTLRATLVDGSTRQVLARREFDAAVSATTDDPYGGVVAANRVVQVVMQQIASFCSETVNALQK